MFFVDGGEELAELFHVVVGEDAEGSFGHAGGIDERCVGELVEEDEVTFACDDWDRGKSSGVAGGEGEGGFGMFRGGDAFLQRGVRGGGAGDESGGGGAGAVFRDAIGEGGGDGGVVGEAEVVVGGEAPEFATVAGDAQVFAFPGGEATEEVFFRESFELLAGIHRSRGALNVQHRTLNGRGGISLRPGVREPSA